MRRNLFLFILFVLHQNSQQIWLKKSEIEKSMVDSISKTMKIIAKLKVTVWCSAEEEDVLSQILKTVKAPVILNAVEKPKKGELDTRNPSEVVLVFNSIKVEQLLNETLWNGNTYFLIITNGFQDVETNFRLFWKFKVINVFVFLKHELDIIIYSFLPYQKSCSLIKPVVVEKYDSSTGTLIKNGDAFRDRMRIKNMNGCPVNITVVDVKPNVMFHDECGCNGTTHLLGIEGNLMNEVAKRLNFNATFVIALDGIGWGWINPAPHGAVGEVFTGRSDFAIGLLAPTLERYENLDLSLPYNGEECITYGVPTGAGASTPNWITILISEFNPIAWGLIFLSFLLTVIFFEFVNKFMRTNWLSSKVDIILFVFSSCLGLPVKIPQYFFLKLLIIFWIIFCFIITVAYKSSMGSKLTVPNRDPDINTFQELLNSKLELTGYNNMLRLLQYTDKEPVIQKMIDRFKVTDFDLEQAVDQIAAERKIAHVRHTTTFLYYALINPKAKGHIHIIKDCIYLYFPMIVTKKHSPFSNRLNQLISRLIESGITKKWRSEYIYSFPPPPKPFLKLSNDHMYGVFSILCFGYLLGLLSFLIEIVYFWCKKCRERHSLCE